MKSRLFLRSIFGVGLLVIAFSVAPAAAHSGGSASIRGTVWQRSQPLRSVWVYVGQNGTVKGRALTGDDGRYYIGDLAEGGYDIVVKSGDYEVYRGRVNLPANQRFDIPLN